MTLSELMPALAANRMSGFLKVQDSPEKIEKALSLGATYSQEVEVLVVIGIGGSSLGVEMLVRYFARGHQVKVFDHLDAEGLTSFVMSQSPETQIGLIYISKSGETVETVSMIYHLEGILMSQKRIVRRRLVITEAKDSTLRQLSKLQGVDFLEIPVEIGGRFSICSPVGIFFLGYFNVMNCEQVVQAVADGLNPNGLAAHLFDYFQLVVERPTQALYFWTYGNRSYPVGLWFQQLWCESLGKATASAKPVAPLIPIEGPSAQHSILQQVSQGQILASHLILSEKALKKGDQGKSNSFGESPIQKQMSAHLGAVYPEVLLQIEAQALQNCLTDDHVSFFVHSIKRADADSLLKFLNAAMLAVAGVGISLGIDPFNQPGVEAIKVYINSQLEAERGSHEASR